ncbi:MAG: hypothetical protein JO002_13570, partial [Burkholderiaceae bacterium]|nr:hypothetical protein [Burkholderiaceae bacterium]
EAISKAIFPIDGDLIVEVDLGRPIGRRGATSHDLVGLDQPVLFAQRVNRPYPTRVAVDAAGEETTRVVLIAGRCRSEPQRLFLRTAWIGTKSMREPWDMAIESQQEFDACLQFWSSNALIHDTAAMGQPFVSTWRKVLRDAGCKYALPGQRSTVPMPA